MITITEKGDFSNTERYLARMKDAQRFAVLSKYGSLGLNALSNATPVESGLTADPGRIQLFNDRDITLFVGITVILKMVYRLRSFFNTVTVLERVDMCKDEIILCLQFDLYLIKS